MLSIRALEQIGQEVISMLVTEYKNTLTEYKKIATRKTINSVQGDQDATTNKITIKISANESLFFIISGRRKGAKLPVRKVGDRFELVPELREWKVAVGYNGADYILAKGISERGIKGVPITSIVLQKQQQKIVELITRRFADIARDEIVNTIKTGFRVGR